jgi:hypothetical protein
MTVRKQTAIRYGKGVCVAEEGTLRRLPKPQKAKDLSGENRPDYLRHEIKWTRRKVIIVGLALAIPYAGAIYVAFQYVSLVLLGFLIILPIFLAAIAYLMNRLTRNL